MTNPHLLTIAAELRLNICKLVLFGTKTTIELTEDIRSDEVVISDEPAFTPTTTSSASTSLLLVCKKMTAEVAPIFHDHVRLHIDAMGVNGDWGELDMGLRHIELPDRMKMPRAFKKLSISTVLARNLSRYRPAPATKLAFKNALPHLQELIVYDERVSDDIDYDAKDKDAKDKVVKEVEKMYSAKESYGWSQLYKFVPGKSQKYTLTQQLFLSSKEVSRIDRLIGTFRLTIQKVVIATMNPGEQKFTYDFCTVEDALVKPDEIFNHQF